MGRSAVSLFRDLTTRRVERHLTGIEVLPHESDRECKQQNNDRI